MTIETIVSLDPGAADTVDMKYQADRHRERAIYPSLAGRRILLTGGGSGIGERPVEAFVGQGARVAFVNIADEASAALIDRLSPGAVHARLYRRCDPTDLDELKAAIADVAAALGGIDVLANYAGTTSDARLPRSHRDIGTSGRT